MTARGDLLETQCLEVAVSHGSVGWTRSYKGITRHCRPRSCGGVAPLDFVRQADDLIRMDLEPARPHQP